jgi:hypothetical protein
MGGEELHGLRAAGTGQGDGAAQHIGEQVGERAIRFHRHALAIDVVVLGGRGGATSEHRLGVAIEGDGVGHSGRALSLQHAIACVVVEVVCVANRYRWADQGMNRPSTPWI